MTLLWMIMRMHPNKGKIIELDADEDVTLVDVDTTVEIDADTQRRMEEDVTDVKEINVAEFEPTIFDDKEVTMTMAQTVIKIKSEKARILDEQMAKRLQDEEIEQAAARERRKKEDLARAKVLQQQYDQKQENIDWNIVVEQIQEKHLDNIKKYQSLKRKPISVAHARKNMIVYLKNMAGDEEPSKKRVTKDTLLQESFKKLRAEVEVSDAVMLLMLSVKLQVDEDCEMARDFVMKIFMEANKPKSRRSLDTSSN
uniref:Uncharacterized protein n=1 Tax=Tanacetum cinerariifolium TaxID=118510 RepID=A0A6L2KAW0_TANCI|nr:hypothetical protein [Tanacetum cinerariifolium]